MHWLLYDIPPGTTSLPAGGPIPAGADEGMSDFGGNGYGGPCPPAGTTHEYSFTLYALDTELALGPGATVDDLALAIDGHILGSLNLSGMYAR